MAGQHDHQRQCGTVEIGKGLCRQAIVHSACVMGQFCERDNCCDDPNRTHGLKLYTAAKRFWVDRFVVRIRQPHFRFASPQKGLLKNERNENDVELTQRSGRS